LRSPFPAVPTRNGRSVSAITACKQAVGLVKRIVGVPDFLNAVTPLIGNLVGVMPIATCACLLLPNCNQLPNLIISYGVGQHAVRLNLAVILRLTSQSSLEPGAIR
jgi:hypothetical protein